MSSFTLRTILCLSLFAIGLGSMTSHQHRQHSMIRRGLNHDRPRSPAPHATTGTTNTTKSKNNTIRRLSRSAGKSTRIIGGQVADPQWYPYIVSLQDSYGGHICGGSLVAPDIIVSASHCAPDDLTTAVVGAFDLTDTSSGNVETFGITTMFIHPDYDDGTLEYDVLVIKIDGVVTVTDPVQINDDYTVPYPSESLTAIGWGATSEDGYEYPDLLQEVELFYVPNRICKRVTDSDGYSIGSGLTSDMMCATDDGKDSCRGDSGGPLIMLGSSPAEDVQVGVVSWGPSCAGPIPGVYHRLSYSYQWIRLLVCSRSAAPPEHFNC